jgi:hypothetical protein
MPKVKTEKTSIKVVSALGNVRYKEFIKVTKLNPDNGVFTIEMAVEVLTATGINQATGKTLVEVEKSYDEIMKKFDACTIEESKVILYTFEYDGAIKEGHRSSYNTPSLSFKVQAGVFIEKVGTATSGVKTYNYEDVKTELKYPPHVNNYFDGRRTDNDRPEHLIPWTQEREDFFLKIQTGMEYLVAQAHEMQNHQAKLLEAVAGGRLMLGAGKEQAWRSDVQVTGG